MIRCILIIQHSKKATLYKCTYIGTLTVLSRNAVLSVLCRLGTYPYLSPSLSVSCSVAAGPRKDKLLGRPVSIHVCIQMASFQRSGGVGRLGSGRRASPYVGMYRHGSRRSRPVRPGAGIVRPHKVHPIRAPRIASYRQTLSAAILHRYLGHPVLAPAGCPNPSPSSRPGTDSGPNSTTDHRPIPSPGVASRAGPARSARASPHHSSRRVPADANLPRPPPPAAGRSRAAD